MKIFCGLEENNEKETNFTKSYSINEEDNLIRKVRKKIILIGLSCIILIAMIILIVEKQFKIN